ncbi:hypothetical protein DKX38_022788 [Salix brachista]|uniref:Uncharacterized protein n=1 Tax=Salix brachista TaxID=2182728 RepID=A0A5N5K0F8_9ROSI|nr:hypothetical protein DKX38_022788 [Salix brachista]
MDPDPKTHPILSYVMARLPSLGNKYPDPSFDIEQPPQPSQPPPQSLFPQLSDPALLSAMRRAVGDVAQTRSVLQTLGPRPDHETVDKAKLKLIEIESNLSKQLEDLVLSPRPCEFDRLEWRAHLAEKEKKIREEAEKERGFYKMVLQLDEMHEDYEKLLKEAEDKLVKIYRKAERGVEDDAEKERVEVEEEVTEEFVGELREGSSKGIERVDLSSRRLRFLPEGFGRVVGLKALNLSNNQLQFKAVLVCMVGVFVFSALDENVYFRFTLPEVDRNGKFSYTPFTGSFNVAIPDSIAGLEILEELNLASNLLEALPDSIGLLQNLKILDVSSNKIEVLPDTICHCRSLLELDVSFNCLTYLPTNIGYEMPNLQRLSIQLNKIFSLPTSIGEMRSLQHLDAHFNQLHGLPLSIGRLTNLEILNLSSNFSDLKELPETFGDLTNLKELDLSNNQISALPDSFGRLDNLTKLNLDQNPLVIPPPEVIKEGVEAVKNFMAKRWLDILVEEERKSMLEVQEQEEIGWWTRSTSWLKTYAPGVSETVSGILSPRVTFFWSCNNATYRELQAHQILIFHAVLFWFCKTINRDMPMLSRTTSSSRTTTLLLLFLLILSLLVSFCAVVCSFYASTANTSRLNWAGLFGPVVLVSGILLSLALLVVAARATVLTWITVVVLLAFAGRRRRVLVQQGTKITADVIMYLIRGGA